MILEILHLKSVVSNCDFPLSYLDTFVADDDNPFEPRKVVVKNKDPKSEYNLGEELGR